MYDEAMEQKATRELGVEPPSYPSGENRAMEPVCFLSGTRGLSPNEYFSRTWRSFQKPPPGPRWAN